MIPVDIVYRHYEDLVECLRLIHVRRIVDVRFGGLTAAQLGDRLAEVRAELDRQTVLALATSAEATIRRDFLARLLAAQQPVFLRRVAFRLRLPTSWWRKLGSLEERLTDLEVRYGRRVPLEEVLAAWKSEGADPHVVGTFKRIIKHRHWLAHGRYYPDNSGYATPPAPLLIRGAITDLFHDFRNRRADFPRP